MPKDEKEVVAEQPVVVAEVVTPKVDIQDDKLKKKQEQKDNLDKAILEVNDELRKKREELKKPIVPVEEVVPVIDDTDPSAKAWNQRIKDNTAPLSNQLEKQKEEVRTFALRKFLADKPSLSKNPEKLKEMMSNYERIKSSTEQTQEGVTMDLDKAYGATFHEELVSAARNVKLDQAKEDMIASDIAVSKGATSETTQAPTKRIYTAEERRIIEGYEANGAPKLD